MSQNDDLRRIFSAADILDTCNIPHENFNRGYFSFQID
jgi:hypothetical protein